MELLRGMRVASFTHWLQGPATTQYLADMGADVIKVEAPGGSHERRWSGAGGRKVAGYGTLYLAANRNTRNMVIDLKSPEGIAVAKRLITSCDAVVENYRPGVMDRLGLGYEAIRAVKPDIIYASATGYGAGGPLSKGPGQDLLVQARAGMVAQTGEHGARPTPIGNSGIDQHGAAVLALGVLGAYVRKLTTGEGTRVEGSLYTACVDFMQEGLTHYFSGRQDRRVLDRDHHLSCWYIEAPYGAYRLKDAEVVISLNPYEKLAQALDCPALAAYRGQQWEKRDEAARALAEAVKDFTFAEIKARFDAHGIWYERVQDFDDMLTDPQAAYAEVLREVDVAGQPAVLINHPNRYDGEVLPFRRMPLKPGQDTRAVLAELGYAADEISCLIEGGAVHEPEDNAR